MFLAENTLVIIGFIPRSGSNYLCDMILRGGGLTFPMEYYFPYDFKERVSFWNSKEIELERIDKDTITDERSWFAEVVRRGGLKCTWTAHEQMLKEVADLVSMISTKYIYLRRRDKVRQAISWYRANKNKRWTSQDPQINPDPPYSEFEIKERLDWIEYDEKQWDEYLKDRDHLELFYEDLNFKTLEQYEEFTGLKRFRYRETDSDYEILRDDLTEEWVKRYVESQHGQRYRDSTPL